MQDCIADPRTTESVLEEKRLTDAFNTFLDSLPETERRIFLCRYWYLDPIADIAGQQGYSVSKVTSILYRTRKKLRTMLETEDLL